MRTPSARQRWKRLNDQRDTRCATGRGIPPRVTGLSWTGDGSRRKPGASAWPGVPPLVDASGNDCVDDLLECARLRRAARRGLLQLDHPGADLLQVLAAQAFSDL